MAGYNPDAHELTRLLEAFREAKAENDHFLREADTHAFVQTRVYRDILNGHRGLLIGRKGSGKTALLLGYEAQESTRYVAHGSIDIRADDFPLDTLFNFFYNNSRRSAERVAKELPQISDLPDFLDPVKVARYAWMQSLRCAAVWVTSDQLLREGGSGLSEHEQKQLRRARTSISYYTRPKLQGNEHASDVVFALLVYFFASVQGVIDHVLSLHSPELAVALASITRALGRKLTGYIDKRVRLAARLIRNELERQERKCLLTLDRFDDYYDEFYSEAAGEGADKRAFLSALLKGLVYATRDLAHDGTFSWIDPLFAIPMDKFLELHLRERADLEQSHIVRVDWTPGELFRYANRRIASALGMPKDQERNAWDRLFPFEVTNRTVRDVKEHSFLYILRHSLWRPRELQMYLSAILRRMEETRAPATEEMFQKVVRSEAELIIRREFLEEFKSEYPGISAVMKKLETLSLRSVMPFTELCDRIGPLKLFDDSLNVADVMIRLFHMGMIGVRQHSKERRGGLDPTVTQNRDEVCYRYSYNYPERDPFTPTGDVAFHPMFFEFLNVRHEERYVVNQLTWEMFDD